MQVFSAALYREGRCQIQLVTALMEQLSRHSQAGRHFSACFTLLSQLPPSNLGKYLISKGVAIGIGPQEVLCSKKKKKVQQNSEINFMKSLSFDQVEAIISSFSALQSLPFTL